LNYRLIMNRMPAIKAQIPAIRLRTFPPRLTPSRESPTMTKYIPSRIHFKPRIVFSFRFDQRNQNVDCEIDMNQSLMN
jgi:hypothetical protein